MVALPLLTQIADRTDLQRIDDVMIGIDEMRQRTWSVDLSDFEKMPVGRPLAVNIPEIRTGREYDQIVLPIDMRMISDVPP